MVLMAAQAAADDGAAQFPPREVRRARARLRVRAVEPSPVGRLLQHWRAQRRMSQLALAHEAGVTPRHVSFVESGRANPSREMVLTLARALDVPLRERNQVLLAAGYAPQYRETGLDDASMAQVRGALDRLLAHHEPHPAVVMDRHWNILRANAAADALFAWLLDGADAGEPPNVVRLMFGPLRAARRQLGRDRRGADPARAPRGGRRRPGPVTRGAARRGARARRASRAALAHAGLRADPAAAAAGRLRQGRPRAAATSRSSRRSARRRTSRCRSCASSRSSPRSQTSAPRNASVASRSMPVSCFRNASSAESPRMLAACASASGGDVGGALAREREAGERARALEAAAELRPQAGLGPAQLELQRDHEAVGQDLRGGLRRRRARAPSGRPSPGRAPPRPSSERATET